MYYRHHIYRTLIKETLTFIETPELFFSQQTDKFETFNDEDC